MSSRRLLTTAVMMLALAGAGLSSQKLTSEDLLARHRAQLGETAKAGEEVAIRGRGRLSTTTMGAGSMDGPFAFTSSGDTTLFTLRFDAETYEGESVGFDGQSVEVAFAHPRSSRRSALGSFLSMNRVIVREGLFGGVLSGRWPLFDLAAREAKVSSEGLKKFDGRPLHRLRYRAKRDQGDLTILLYFEPDTFRHVASVYASSRAQGLGLTPESSSQQSDQYFTLEERFSDFATEGGVTVPRTWVVRYERSGNTTAEWKYTLTVDSVERKPAAARP